MKHLHRDEKAIQMTNCAGEAEETELDTYATEVMVTITVPTGDIVAESREQARKVALWRAEQMVRISGNGHTAEWEPCVNRIGAA